MFQPDYHNLVNAAKNIQPERTPLYEHSISETIMEKVLGVKFAHLKNENPNNLEEYFKHYCNFFLQMGYDTVSFEAGIAPILPHGGALSNQCSGWIDSKEKFLSYPFEKVLGIYENAYDKLFAALKKNMPKGMLAVGGAGYGVFEIAQDLCGFENLCFLRYDEPDVFAALFEKIGDMMLTIWKWILDCYGDVFCVCRMGDDLGYKSNTMLPADDIKKHIVPQYARLVEQVHSYGKPFLLHSCGNIFCVMDEIINVAKIDAKHSNEDQIASFDVWVEKYGDRIGNFGGIDTDHLVRTDTNEIVRITEELMKNCAKGHGGFAAGSGNSIPDYVDADKYLAMVQTVRRCRGEKI